MTPFNCLIVDDEELARRLLRTFCARLPQLEVVGEASNPVAALQLLKEEKVDILFLDIQMPEMTGFEFLRTVRHPPEVILTTAYPDYALQGFEHDVVDYLLKPFPFELFVKAVNKTVAYRSRAEGIAPASAPPDATCHVVHADRKVYRIPYADLLYIESQREYVAYHAVTGRTLALGSLKQLETSLPENFLRVHKSFIVAKDKVEVLEGNILHLGAARIPIGGSYREQVKKILLH